MQLKDKTNGVLYKNRIKIKWLGKILSKETPLLPGPLRHKAGGEFVLDCLRREEREFCWVVGATRDSLQKNTERR